MNRASPLLPLAAAALAMDIGIARLGYGLMLPAIKAELPGSFGLYGSIATLHQVGYLAGSFVAPLMLRRLSWRAAFVLAHGLVALGLVGQANVSTVEMLSWMRVALGFASGLGVLSALGAALDSVDGPRRMNVSAFIWAGVAAGILVSSPAGSWVLGHPGRWRTVSLVSAWPTMAIALLGLVTRFPSDAAGHGKPKATIMDGARQLRRSVYLLWSYAFYGFAYFVYVTFALIRVVHVMSGAIAATVWLWAAFGATAAVGSLTFPMLMRGHLRAHAMTATVGVGTLGALVSLGPGPGWTVAGALLAGLGLTATPAVASAFARERVSTAVGPSAIATATIVCSAGQMAGPLVTGVAIDVFGLGSMIVLVLAGYTLATITAVIDQSRHRETATITA